MTPILFIYEGYTLGKDALGFCSKIDGELLRFDSAVQWKQFIEYKKYGKHKTKKSNRG